MLTLTATNLIRHECGNSLLKKIMAKLYRYILCKGVTPNGETRY